MVGSREKPPATRVFGAAIRERGGWAFGACSSPRGSGFGFSLARGGLGKETRVLDASPRPVGANDSLAPAAALLVGAGGRVGRAATNGAGGTAVLGTTDRLATAISLPAPFATPGAGMLCLLAGEAATGATLASPLRAGTLGRTESCSCFFGCCSGAPFGTRAGGAV